MILCIISKLSTISRGRNVDPAQHPWGLQYLDLLLLEAERIQSFYLIYANDMIDHKISVQSFN
jgi:hypothetical protein